MASEPMFTSPKRVNGFFVDQLGSPPIKDSRMLPWNWGSGAGQVALSPASSCGSPQTPQTPERCDDARALLRRGRPRADSISSLIQEGGRVDTHIKCQICHRVFPREKSLQAHMRTHTGERPFRCDYPDCGKAFCQSGQLKTHQRLHTGEKPFVCSYAGCNIRFTHANRHCQEHPMATLKRADQDTCTAPDPDVLEASSPQVKQWLKSYYQLRQERTPLKFRPGLSSSGTKRSLHQDIENQYARDNAKRHALEDPLTNVPRPPVLPLGECNSPVKRAPPNTPEKLPELPQSPFVLHRPPVIRHTEMEKSPNKLSEHQEKIMGALALMQLAQAK